MSLTEEHTETDILILGATGFTGKLITHYLSTHSQRSQFTLGIGGRSIAKLEKLSTDLSLNRDLRKGDGVRVVQVDLNDETALENVVQSARIIINAIGPYFLSGTPIVRLCARNGVHYLDISGETHWHQHLIKAHDYTASRSGAVIVPSCAFNSAPADICVYLAAKALRDISPSLLPGKSTTVYDFKGGYSGGTAATTISTFGNVDHEVLQRTMEPYTLSPIVGNQPSTGFEFVSKLSIPKQFGGQIYYGCFSTMASINTAVVQRTFGLLEMISAEHHGKHEEPSIRYGPDLIYSEFLLARNPFTAFLSSVSLVFAFVFLLFKPSRYLFSKFLPKPGDGPSESALQKGHFVITNLTASGPPSESSSNSVKTDTVYVKTVIKGQIDPGYVSSSVMVSEAALAILLPLSSVSSPQSGETGTKKLDNISNLPPLARRGGLLTPISAFGDVLIKRLEETGMFEVSSEVFGE